MKIKIILLSLCSLVIITARAQFISQISEPDANITLSAIQMLGSNFVVAGSENNEVLLSEIDINGTVLSSRTITIVDETVLPYVSSMIVDSDGKIVIAGYRVTPDVYQYTSFVVKYDYATGTVDWMRLFENPGSAFLKIIEKKTDGPYIVCGQSINAPKGEEGILYSVNRNTGNFILLNNYNYNNSSETYYSLVKADGGYYTANRYNFDGGGSSRMRATISKFSYTGSQLFTKAYIKNITTDIARLYASDICFANGSLYMPVHGDETGALINDDLFIVRAKTDGNLNWAKMYNLTHYGDDGSFSSIKSKGTAIYTLGALNDGATDYTGDIFIMKMDSSGAVIWANSYGIQGNSRAGKSDALLINGSNILAVGYTHNDVTGLNEGAVLFVKASTGNLPGGCSTNEPVTVTTKSSTSYAATLTAVTHTYTFSDSTAIATSSDESNMIICMNGARFEQPESTIEIMPNPTNGQFQLELNGEENLIEIYNYNGQLMHSVSTEEIFVQMDITSMPAGIYYVKVRNVISDEIQTVTIIKE